MTTQEKMKELSIADLWAMHEFLKLKVGLFPASDYAKRIGQRGTLIAEELQRREDELFKQ